MVKRNMETFLEMQNDPFWSEKLANFFVFAVVAQYKSIRTAAKNMYISPQALNKQVSTLEKKLGMPLIQRSPRGFQLTAYGELVCNYAADLLHNAKQLKDNLKNMYTERNHPLRLAYSDNLNDSALYMHMVEFQAENPQCKAKIFRGNFSQVMEVACEKEHYLVVTTRPSNTEGFDVTVLHKAKYYLLMSKNHPLSKMSSINLQDLADTQLILSGELLRVNQDIVKYCTKKKLPLSIHLETRGFAQGINLCRQDKGVMLIVDYIEDQIGIEDLVQIPGLSGLSNLELVLLIRKDMECSLMENKFIEHMKAYSQK